jgi:hypothetical protein
MKNVVIAAVFAAFTLSQASAKPAVCTGENFAKMVNYMTALPHGTKRMVLMREITVMNTSLSNGDANGACVHYAKAQRIQETMRDPFEDLHLE